MTTTFTARITEQRSGGLATWRVHAITGATVETTSGRGADLDAAIAQIRERFADAPERKGWATVPGTPSVREWTTG
jgi:hypothetical protein